MRDGHLFYWTTAGALLGYGAVGVLSNGFPFLFVGMGLVIFGLIRRWFAGSWSFLVGFGVVPAIVLVLAIITAPSACLQTGSQAAVHASGSQRACGVSLTVYWLLTLVFAAVALAGMLIGPWHPYLRRLLRGATAILTRDTKGRENG